jgi:hypothetical protein
MQLPCSIWKLTIAGIFSFIAGQICFAEGGIMSKSNNNIYAENDQTAKAPESGGNLYELIFASYAEDTSDVGGLLACVESIRAFAGKFSKSPFWIYMPDSLLPGARAIIEKSPGLNVEIKTSTAPAESIDFFFGGKPFAAARCEQEAAGKTAVLIWLDTDTIFLGEPVDFVLEKGICLKYRPVMHKNIGLLYTDPIDSFWGRAFEKFSVKESTLFPMTAAASGETLKPYFNAGLLVLNPKCGLFQVWSSYFQTLYQDSAIVTLCKQDRKKNIFLFQVALTSAILNKFKRTEMIELSDKYNYPIFFDQMFGAPRPFDSIEGVITMRHEGYFQKPAPDWEEKLKGPKDRIAWIKAHLFE